MLTGKAVLIVETEFIIALGIQAALEQAMGAPEIILASNAQDAIRTIDKWRQVSLAIIEVEANLPHTLVLAKRLQDAGIAVLGISADSQLAGGMPNFPDMPILVKPIPDDHLLAAIRTIFGNTQNE